MAAHPQRVQRAMKAGADGHPGEAGVEELRAELQQERDRHLRTSADFENYRHRVERDRELAPRRRGPGCRTGFRWASAAE